MEYRKLARPSLPALNEAECLAIELEEDEFAFRINDFVTWGHAPTWAALMNSPQI